MHTPISAPDFKTPDSLNAVAAFHHTFKHPVLESPKIPEKKRCELRISLLQEELDELKAAVADGNMVEIADALCDIQYVLAGAIHEFGLGSHFKELFDEVQRSNMSKSCSTEEEAQATADHFLATKGEECYHTRSGDQFLVYRKSDNKTMKSIRYSPANLGDILK